MRRLVSLTLLLTVGLVSQAHAQYQSEQVIASLYKYIRELMNDQDGDDEWLSLSMVGAVASKDDPASINDLANYCPEPSPTIKTFGNIRKLDAIYEKIIQGLVGPTRSFTEEYYEALAKMRDPNTNQPTPEYKAYNSYQTQFAEAMRDYFAETNDANKSLLLFKARNIENDWKVFGYKVEIDKAILVTRYDPAAFSAERELQRSDVLLNYRTAGMDYKYDAQVPAFRSPLSEVSPPVEKWEDPNGWLAVSYSNHQFNKFYSQTDSRKSGFGGFSIGFVMVGGKGGGGKGDVTKVESVKDFNYQFELKRIQVRRPWLDTDVLFQPTAWTWKNSKSTKMYPRVAGGLDDDGKPVQPESVTYDNADIGCVMLPLEFLIARKRSIEVTVSKSDYNQITTSGSSGGGASFGGIFGGGSKKSWTTTSVKESGNDVTFKVEDPGISVVGLISKVVPVLPSPNPDEEWPEDAWLPGN